ncbi:MAG: hypothetical protein UW70_C0058G0009 [Candidatus Peregrinibacteria bacterium GW2011_GWA2_44_7]|nr:MAG: hypothetical protein UW70_C0058G0009 [Candidatus Peregrinibacteria bacterium GW2011_GWA2_44_7]
MRLKSNKVAKNSAHCGEPPAHVDDWEYGGVGYHHDTNNLCCRIREPVNMQCLQRPVELK